MFADILLVLGHEQNAASYGLSFARGFNADVTAVWPCASAPLFQEHVDGETRYALLVEEGNEGQKKVDADRRFLTRAAESGVNAHVFADAKPQRRFSGKLNHLARAYDLAIVEQSEATRYAPNGGLIGSLVSGCSRPVLAIPFIQRDPPSFETVVVAWDASASAARALGDALPILKRAGLIEIVTVANAGREFASPDCDDVVRHLSRHGVPAVSRQIPGGDTTADTLLSYAAERGVTFMVAGSYGHTRLAESLIGGVTRTLLESMTIPLFISH